MRYASTERRIEALEQAVAAMGNPPDPIGGIEIAERIGLALDPWQISALSTPWQQSLLNCARQTGKSTIAALWHLEDLLSHPGARGLITSPSDRQSGFVFDSVVDFYRRLGGTSGVIESTRDNKREFALANGSKLWAVPGKPATIRGFAGITRATIDEAAQASAELYAAIRPMLIVRNGRLLTLSTPFGRVGWWWDAWQNGGDDWYRVFLPASKSPRYTPQRIAMERESLPSWVFASEFECQFVDTDQQVFPSEFIEAAFAVDVAPRVVRPRLAS